MNLYDANMIVNHIAVSGAKHHEDTLLSEFAGATIRVQPPVLYFRSFADCVRYVSTALEAIPEHHLVTEHLREDPEETAEELYAEAVLKAWAKIHDIVYKRQPGETREPNTIIEGRYVVASACKYGDLILVGARHFSPAMQSQIRQIKEDKLFEFEAAGKAEQGFVDQFDVFMDRIEAYQVALAAGQINSRRIKTPLTGAELFSEDLY